MSGPNSRVMHWMSRLNDLGTLTIGRSPVPHPRYIFPSFTVCHIASVRNSRCNSPLFSRRGHGMCLQAFVTSRLAMSCAYANECFLRPDLRWSFQVQRPS